MSRHEPKVSIVIPFYNDPYVREAVDSALSQSYRNIEVIVVDDGSTAHAELLKPYGDRIHYLGKANGGTASALNHGFRHASGEYIAWLSSDDVFYPDKIKQQLDGMRSVDAWIGHTGFDCIDGKGRYTQFAIAPPKDTHDLLRSFRHSNPVNGCTVMMRKPLYQAIGPFNERLPYTQDLDYWFRVLLAGFPFHLTPDPLIAYRWHEQMGTLRNKQAIEQETQETFHRYENRYKAFLLQLGIK
ncbi:glycosyl transferase family 2 [Paenibacillus curdlanolyticus YK9]|uniref:Glycosyl transferase family 2 n=1 Tax=Paenibacillus curdlanolyticus YK9 TaxID=717606 RepID=E0IFH4_9BACL|nr:glycosyltransferase [Paenibacillus curdlanolyticus]EFM08950.1 glycosyl transferase family 2 [Paenibacillus curdlanolyticus YK9]